MDITKRMALPAVALISALMLAACGNSSNGGGGGATSGEGEPIRIGMSNPMSGSAAAGTKPVADGLKAWIDHVNREGGIDGHQIKLDIRDDAFNPTQAVSNIRQFIEDGVFAVVGDVGTPQNVAVAPILRQNGVPLFFPYAGVEALLDPANTNVFSVTPLYEDEAKAMVAYAFDKFGPGSVYVVAQRELGPEAAIASVKEAAGAEGQFAGSSVFNLGAPDLSSLALQVADANPDYVLMLTTVPEAARVITALDKQNALPEKFLGMPTSTGAALSAAVGNLVGDTFHGAVPNRPPADPAAKECLDAFSEASPAVTPDIISLYGCGTGQALQHGIEQLGDEVTSEAFIKEVSSWSAEEASPLFPALTFTDDRRLGLDQMFVVQSKGTDQFQTVDSLDLN